MQQVSVVVYLEDPRSGVLSTAFSVLVGCYGSHGIKATVQEWTGKVSKQPYLTTLCWFIIDLETWSVFKELI